MGDGRHTGELRITHEIGGFLLPTLRWSELTLVKLVTSLVALKAESNCLQRRALGKGPIHPKSSHTLRLEKIWLMPSSLFSPFQEDDASLVLVGGETFLFKRRLSWSSRRTCWSGCVGGNDSKVLPC